MQRILHFSYRYESVWLGLTIAILCAMCAWLMQQSIVIPPPLKLQAAPPQQYISVHLTTFKTLEIHNLNLPASDNTQITYTPPKPAVNQPTKQAPQLSTLQMAAKIGRELILDEAESFVRRASLIAETSQNLKHNLQAQHTTP